MVLWLGRQIEVLSSAELATAVRRVAEMRRFWETRRQRASEAKREMLSPEPGLAFRELEAAVLQEQRRRGSEEPIQGEIKL